MYRPELVDPFGDATHLCQSDAFRRWCELGTPDLPGLDVDAGDAKLVCLACGHRAAAPQRRSGSQPWTPRHHTEAELDPYAWELTPGPFD